MWLVLMDNGDMIYNGLYFETFSTEEEADEFINNTKDEFIYLARVVK